MSDEPTTPDEQPGPTTSETLEADAKATADADVAKAKAEADAAKAKAKAEADAAKAKAAEPDPATKPVEPGPAERAAASVFPPAPAYDASSSSGPRPELVVGGAFAGGLVLAWLLRRHVG